jgi:hypothetical protein
MDARVIPLGKPRKNVTKLMVLGVHNFIFSFGSDSDGDISIDIVNLLIKLPQAQ